MIHIKQPALAINSPDVPDPRYTMWDTLDAPWRTDATFVVTQIIYFARKRAK